MTPLTPALKNLAYFSVFNFPLTKQEIEKYSGQVFEPLKELYEINGYYSVVDPSLWVDRQAREAASLAKIEAATRLFKKIAWWPYLKAVLVTGSTAAMNAEAGSDVDVLIISSKDTLWLTRLVVVIFLILTRTYRKFICPNIWLAEDVLGWPDQNIHSACDLILARPIINEDEVYEHFLFANQWVQEYWSFNVGAHHDAPATRAIHESPLQLLNQLLFKLETIRRSVFKIITTDEINYNRIQYKKNDSKDRILRRFEEISHPHVAHGAALGH